MQYYQNSQNGNKKKRRVSKADDKKLCQEGDQKSQENYKVGETVLVDIRRQIRANQRRIMKWVGPCKVCRVEEGPLYYIEYWTEGLLMKFNKVYP